MGLLKSLLQIVAKEALPRAGNLLKEMIDPNSEMNRRPNFFGHTKRLDNDIKYEQKKAEYERMKYDGRVAQNQNQTFDHQKQILDDIRSLELREKQIALELQRLPVTEMEMKMKLHEEMQKNKAFHNHLLGIIQDD